MCPVVSSSCDPMNCGLPGSSVHRILQARILKWVVISSSREFSLPRDRTQVSHIAGGLFTVWASREAICMNNIPLYWYTTCCLFFSWVDRCLDCFPLFWLLWILLQWTFIYRLVFFAFIIFGCAGSLFLCVGFSPVAASGGHSLVVLCGLHVAVASPEKPGL